MKLLIPFVIISFSVFLVLLGREAGKFLVINEEPVKSDVIIMLSGGGIERLEKSVELYQQEYAPFFIISNGSEDNLANAAQTMGINPESLILENKSKSTRDNAFYTKKLMEKHQFDSAIVVSSDFHMRRVKSNFTHVFRGSGIRLTYTSANNTGYNPDQWWSIESNRMTTVVEYIKLVGNFFGIHGNRAKEKLEELTVYSLCHGLK